MSIKLRNKLKSISYRNQSLQDILEWQWKMKLA